MAAVVAVVVCALLLLLIRVWLLCVWLLLLIRVCVCVALLIILVLGSIGIFIALSAKNIYKLVFRKQRRTQDAKNKEQQNMHARARQDSSAFTPAPGGRRTQRSAKEVSEFINPLFESDVSTVTNPAFDPSALADKDPHRLTNTLEDRTSIQMLELRGTRSHASRRLSADKEKRRPAVVEEVDESQAETATAESTAENSASGQSAESGAAE